MRIEKCWMLNFGLLLRRRKSEEIINYKFWVLDYWLRVAGCELRLEPTARCDWALLLRPGAIAVGAFDPSVLFACGKSLGDRRFEDIYGVDFCLKGNFFLIICLKEDCTEITLKTSGPRVPRLRRGVSRGYFYTRKTCRVVSTPEKLFRAVSGTRSI